MHYLNRNRALVVSDIQEQKDSLSHQNSFVYNEKKI